jgi:hypothetical protein
MGDSSVDERGGTPKADIAANRLPGKEGEDDRQISFTTSIAEGASTVGTVYGNNIE